MATPDDPAMQPRPLSDYSFVAIPDGAATIKVFIIGENHLKSSRHVIVVAKTKEETISIPCFAFLLEREDGTSWLWDLGMRPDPENGPPALSQVVKTFQVDGELHPEPFCRLMDSGYSIDKIQGVFLSHSHFDHYGDLDAVPANVPVIVGPGTKADLGKGYPGDKSSTWFTRWLDNKALRELPPLSQVGKDSATSAPERTWESIGAFGKGMDFLGDGSLWLLDAPGHCRGHVCALVRTTANPPTYVILAGDTCHHASNYLPVPTSPDNDKRTVLPFFTLDPSKPPATMDYDSVLSTETTGRLTRMSAEENVMVVLAHEEGLDELLPKWPESINDWKARGWKEEKEKELVRKLDKTGYP